MASAAKMTANRKNALRSTGPRSAAGKERARMNALGLGIYAQSRILPLEDPEAYRRLLEELRLEWQPEGSLERILVEQLADGIWTLQRLRRAEEVVFTREVQIFANRRHYAELVREHRRQMTSESTIDRMLATEFPQAKPREKDLENALASSVESGGYIAITDHVEGGASRCCEVSRTA